MACPVCGTVIVTTFVGGGELLFCRDRFRSLWLLAVALSTAAWLFYFNFMRLVPLRVVLEVGSVLLALGMLARVGWLLLVKKEQPKSFLFRGALALFALCAPYLRNPIVFAGHVWLLAVWSVDLTTSVDLSRWHYIAPLLVMLLLFGAEVMSKRWVAGRRARLVSDKAQS